MRNMKMSNMRNIHYMPKVYKTDFFCTKSCTTLASPKLKIHRKAGGQRQRAGEEAGWRTKHTGGMGGDLFAVESAGGMGGQMR